MSGKKIAAVLLGLLLTVSATACGGSTPTSESTAPAASTSTTEAAESTAEEAPAESAAITDKEPITYNFLHCWNGGAASFPDGWENGQLAKLITEETGVSLNVETITSSETEKLALVFASGDVPDIANVPFWNTNPGGEGEQIKNAAVGGMLLGLNEYMDRFPNVKRAMTENIASAFKELHYEHPDFGGERYIIPNKGREEADITNWAYGVHARKDILESLNVDPKSIQTADDLYGLLVKIRDGGFVDINGKPVIPAGNWHNGWSYEQYILTFQPGGFTNWDVVDGKITHEYMLQNEIDKILYMRKLVSEGLYDAEALTQTDTMGKEKAATGRLATQGCHWPHQNEFFESTLYLTNPEMEYVTLGPFIQADGSNPTSVNRKGVYGFGALILSADIEKPERALAMIDYLSSTEGRKLVGFGIEGVHYNDENGIPVRTEEWAKIKAEDQQTWNLEGFGWGNVAVEDCAKSMGWDPDYNKPGFVYAREVRPLAFFDGYSAEDISSQWPGKAAYDEKMSTSDYANIKKVAITAASDDEAIKILQEYRAKMIDAGYEEMMAYVQERMDADPSIVY